MEFYLALLLLLLALACWGSWSNTLLFNKGCFEIYFLGLCFGYGLTGFLAFTRRDDLLASIDNACLIAVAAGAVNNVGQLSLVFSIQLTGMTIAIPLIMGIELILGTILLYFQESDEDAILLFSGVFLVLMAVACDILSQLQIIADESNEELSGLLKAARSASDLLHDMEKPRSQSARVLRTASRIDVLSSIMDNPSKAPSAPFSPRLSSAAILENDTVRSIRKRTMRALSLAGLIDDMGESVDYGSITDNQSPGSEAGCDHLPPISSLRSDSLELQMSGKRRSKTAGSLHSNKPLSEKPDTELLPAAGSAHEEDLPSMGRIFFGIIVAILAGMSFAGWPLIVGEEDDSLPWEKFYIFFAFGMFLMGLITAPLSFIASRQSMDSIHFRGFILGTIGGIVQGSGSFFLFWARETIHFVVAISIVRCAPVIAALWGIFFWKELEHAGSTAKLYIVLMFVFYICAIFLIAYSDQS